MKTRALKREKGLPFWVTAALSVLLGLLFAFLTEICVRYTTFMKLDLEPGGEVPIVQPDFWPGQLAAVLVCGAVVFFAVKSRILERLPLPALRVMLLVFQLAIGIFWVRNCQSKVVFDAEDLMITAYDFSLGKFEDKLIGGYLQRYPFQLGMIFVLQHFWTLCDDIKEIWFEQINVIAAAAGYWLLCSIGGRIYPERKKQLQTLLVLAGFFVWQPLFYCTFLYGTILGLFFSLLSFYCLLRFTEGEKGGILWYAGGFFSIAAAIFVKSNYQVFLIALMLFLLLSAWQNRRPLWAFLALLLAVTAKVNLLAVWYYYIVSGGQMAGEGIPSAAWIAMGFQWDGGTAGWYNGYNREVFDANAHDTAATAAAAWENLRQSLQYYAANLAEGFAFMKEKILTQWTEPTFQSIWVSYYARAMDGLPDWLVNIYTGTAHTVIVAIMNVGTMLIWCGNLLAAVLGFRRANPARLTLPIAVLGGFLISVIWEAKALYILPYFVYAIPGGVFGWLELGCLFNEKK